MTILQGILKGGAILGSFAAGILLADILWLITWRFLATNKEIMKVAGTYRLTRLDRWLIQSLGPKQ